MPRLRHALVNGSAGDPGLFLELGRDATLFDCGHLMTLRTAWIHKVRDLFVSHAHVDHFFGFDWLLRVFLGENRSLRVFGPAGMGARVAAKLEAYTWNVDMDFALEVEVRAVEPGLGRVKVSRLRCRHGLEKQLDFAEEELTGTGTGTGTDRVATLVDTPTHVVRACELDHGTQCLAFALEQKRGVRVKEEGIARLGLARGPWLGALKAAILSGRPPDEPLEVEPGGRSFRLGELAEACAEVVPGAKVAYVSDTLYTEEIAARVAALAAAATTFYCEAKFLDEDRSKAAASRHLTAREAGLLARRAGARELVVFHPSPKYQADYGRLAKEARREMEPVRFQEQPLVAGFE